ncbi:hypothetical protein [Caballeronia glebae]|uniref:hypothetical protein n=1 Tax=Caballeronia glebae TaxID=1777143 RepID=UPI0038BB0D5F
MQTNTNTSEVPRVAASVDRDTYDALERYRRSVEQSTGIKVTMSSAAAAVLRRGLESLPA